MRFPSRLRRSSRGFTLIELLVVIVIIAILMAIAIPAYLSQQVKAKDSKAKQYLSYAYRDIRSGIPETNNQFPANVSMVSWVQQSNPELTSVVGNCYALGSLITNTVTVDSSSTNGNLVLCTKSDSGNIWKLAATPASAPNFVDATVVPLTTSGNEVTDTTRAAGLQGDGRAPPDSSTGIWEGTTNLIANGGFETNTAGWIVFNNPNATLTRDTTTSKFGAASLRVNGTSGFSGSQFVIAAPPTTTYTLSAWVKTSSPGLTLKIDDAGSNFTSVALVADGTWRRYTGTITTGAAATSVNAYTVLGSAPYTAWVDGVQVEQKSIATPYVETNGSTASRAAARVQLPAALLNTTQGWVAMRVRMGYASGTRSSTDDFALIFQDSTHYIECWLDGSTRQFKLTRANGGSNNAVSAAQTWLAGDPYTVIWSWTATQLKVSVNGAAFVTQPNALIPTITAPLLDIGNGSIAGDGIIDSDILWLSSGAGTLADADAATINGYANNDSSVSSFPTIAQANFVWNGVGPTGSLK
jgi:prepilin-type N-terminal cleavage/methylation domain-containing protein